MKFLPCRYRNQQKSWIDRVLFEERVREMDKKFVYEGRKVALVIGNCPVHPQIENLKSIKLFFLSLNTTSQTQPMDQGVTRLLKLYYRKNVVRKMIRIVEKKNTLKNFFSARYANVMQLEIKYRSLKSFVLTNTYVKSV